MKNRIMSITETFQLFVDMWKLYKKYAGRKLNDTEMDNFRDESMKIHTRYQTALAKEFILAVNNEIDRTLKFLEKT